MPKMNKKTKNPIAGILILAAIVALFSTFLSTQKGGNPKPIPVEESLKESFIPVLYIDAESGDFIPMNFEYVHLKDSFGVLSPAIIGTFYTIKEVNYVD